MEVFRLVFAVVGILFVGTAWAAPAPTITLGSGSRQLTIADGSTIPTAFDSNPATGDITFLDNDGFWTPGTRAYTTGAGLSDLHMGSWEATKTPGTLKITFNQTVTSLWTGPDISAAVGGTLAPYSTATFETFINNTLVSHLDFSSNSTAKAFSGNESFFFNPSDPEIVELIATINDGKGSGRPTSFDYSLSLTPTPVPNAMLLLGSGLFTTGVFFRRRRNG